MTVIFESVQFLSGLSDGSTKRTMTQRTGEIFNVKDYGAKGDGSTNDAAAITAAVTAMYAANGGIVFFPPGAYRVNSTVDISNNTTQRTGGIITGSGRNATTITGSLGNGFIFSVTDGTGAPEEISNLSLSNGSTVIGTGALIYNNSNGGRIINCNFSGMTCILMPSNIFNCQIENCTFGNNIDVTTGTAGTFGIAGGACNIFGCRDTGSFQAGIQLGGGEPCIVSGNSNENCTVGLVAGMNTGWASSCTVSGNVLTVGGNLGSTSATTQFSVGSEIFMKGLTTTADWGTSPLDAGICHITGLGTGTGYAGTYTISRSATISSPVPCLSRSLATIAGAMISGYGTEACYYCIFVVSAAACVFEASGGSGTPLECVDAFGNLGFTANSSFYIYDAQSCSFIGCTNNANGYNAGFYFDPNKTPICSLISCSSGKAVDVVTGNSSTISLAAGNSSNAGTILNVVSITTGGSGSSVIGIGMKVTGSGVSANTVITGNHVSDGTLTGAGLTGTYRVNNSQLVTGNAITIHGGDDYILPSTNSGKTGVELFNTVPQNIPAAYTSGLNSLGRTYASLPGNVGSNSNIQVVDGMEYSITDGLAANCGDSSCTTWGTDVTGGGGALHLQVRYNASAAKWRLTGK